MNKDGFTGQTNQHKPAQPRNTTLRENTGNGEQTTTEQYTSKVSRAQETPRSARDSEHGGAKEQHMTDGFTDVAITWRQRAGR